LNREKAKGKAEDAGALEGAQEQAKAKSKKAKEKKPAAKKAEPGKAGKKELTGKAKKPAAKRATRAKAGKSAGSEKQRKIRPSGKSGQSETAAGAETVDPFEVAKRKVKGSVTAIVDAMVARAKRGSCPHAKTLLEMTGAKRMFDGEGEAQESGEPWAKLVLERLDEAESREEPAPAPEPCEATAAEA
jgi:hypothetical protein